MLLPPCYPQLERWLSSSQPFTAISAPQGNQQCHFLLFSHSLCGVSDLGELTHFRVASHWVLSHSLLSIFAEHTLPELVSLLKYDPLSSFDLFTVSLLPEHRSLVPHLENFLSVPLRAVLSLAGP